MTVGPHRSRLGWAGTLFTSGVLLLGACTAETKTSAEDFCGDLRRTPSLASVLTGFADQDADQLDRALDDAEEAFTALERSAPDEIRSDVEALVALVQAVIDGGRGSLHHQSGEEAQLGDDLRPGRFQLRPDPMRSRVEHARSRGFGHHRR